jgi:hypothetical protein
VGKTVGKIDPFLVKMRQERLPELAIRLFCHYYHQVATGYTGFVPGEVARPVASASSTSVAFSLIM